MEKNIKVRKQMRRWKYYLWMMISALILLFVIRPLRVAAATGGTSLSTATSVNLNTFYTHTSTYDKYGTTYYYKVTLSKPGILTLYVEKPTNCKCGTSCSLDFSVYDTSKKEVFTGNISSTASATSTTQHLGAAAGTYYISFNITNTKLSHTTNCSASAKYKLTLESSDSVITIDSADQKLNLNQKYNCYYAKSKKCIFSVTKGHDYQIRIYNYSEIKGRTSNWEFNTTTQNSANGVASGYTMISSGIAWGQSSSGGGVTITADSSDCAAYTYSALVSDTWVFNFNSGGLSPISSEKGFAIGLFDMGLTPVNNPGNSTNKKISPTLKFTSSALTKQYGDKDFTNVLTKLTDGAISYSSSNTDVATVNSSGKVTIMGVGTAIIKAAAKETAKYEAKTVSYNLTVNPETIKISKASPAKAAVTLKWGKKKTQVTGYEIQYSTSSKFKNPKKITIKKNTVTSKKISKLKNKKKYYFRIRTYKTVNGKKYYSSWSKVKSVKTK